MVITKFKQIKKKKELKFRYVPWTFVVSEPSVIGSFAQDPLSGSLDLSQTPMLFLSNLDIAGLRK